MPDQEAKKLEQIQQELARIDGTLNTDVRFLRDSIEQASLGRTNQSSNSTNLAFRYLGSSYLLVKLN